MLLQPSRLSEAYNQQGAENVSRWSFLLADSITSHILLSLPFTVNAVVHASPRMAANSVWHQRSNYFQCHLDNTPYPFERLVKQQANFTVCMLYKENHSPITVFRRKLLVLPWGCNLLVSVYRVLRILFSFFCVCDSIYSGFIHNHKQQMANINITGDWIEMYLVGMLSFLAGILSISC